MNRTCNIHSISENNKLLTRGMTLFTNSRLGADRYGTNQDKISPKDNYLMLNNEFDLDQLLVTFSSQFEHTEERKLDRTAMSNAVDELIRIIWLNCGFCFRHLCSTTDKYNTYYLRNCQDASFDKIIVYL